MKSPDKTSDCVLGLDIGRVIMARTRRNEPSVFHADIAVAATAAASDGVFTVVPSLVRAFQGRVWLVSKASRPTQVRTRAWLAHHSFFERTGVQPDRLVFCLRWDEKARICQELGITHFVDDRLDILNSLEGIVEHRFWFTPDPTDAKQAPYGVRPVHSWRQPNLVKTLTKGVR